MRAAAIAAEVVGVCQRALEMTLEYVKDRKQFGVPVGSFQAVSPPLRADAAAHRERALDGLLRRLGRRRRSERLGEAAALAAAAAATGGREVTSSAIQAHGGIGFTWEADVHWLYKRAAARRGAARRRGAPPRGAGPRGGGADGGCRHLRPPEAT